jgi:hypothetical protein
VTFTDTFTTLTPQVSTRKWGVLSTPCGPTQDQKDLAVQSDPPPHDRLRQIMEMFHQFGETMISADSLREAIEDGDFEANGFARNREEAQELGQALVEHGLVFDRNIRSLTLAGTGSRKTARTARHNADLDNAVLNIVTATPGLNTTEVPEKGDLSRNQSEENLNHEPGNRR